MGAGQDKQAVKATKVTTEARTSRQKPKPPAKKKVAGKTKTRGGK